MPSCGVRYGSAAQVRTFLQVRSAMRLTERKIETLTADGGRKDRLVFDDAQRGLAVRVTATGGRTYLCQYTLHGQKWRGTAGSPFVPSLLPGGGGPAPRIVAGSDGWRTGNVSDATPA